MMVSFHYYDQDPSGFCFLVQVRAFVILNPHGATKFKYKNKTQKNSGRSSKMTSSCKWPAYKQTFKTQPIACVKKIGAE